MSRFATDISSFNWNLAGVALPAVAAILALPTIVHKLGPELFGIFSLSSILVGYLLLLDFGVSRALTLYASQIRASGRQGDITHLYSQGISKLVKFSVVGSLVIAALCPVLVPAIPGLSSALQAEAAWALALAVLTVPFVLVGAAWRSLLEVYGRFDWLNMVQIPFGVATAILPALMLWGGGSLIAVMFSILAVRVLNLMALRWRALPLLPEDGQQTVPVIDWTPHLVRFGGWLTVSNVISPIMVHFDRALIVGLISVSALGYYTVSYEVSTRMWVIAAAATAVLYPTMSRLLSRGSSFAAQYYQLTWSAVFGAIVLPAAALAFFAPEILRTWIGEDFGSHGAVVLQILSAGVFINCLAQVSLNVILAAGRSDWVGKLHIVELLPYLGLLLICVKIRGIEGAAAAWTVRAVADAIALTWMANKIVAERSSRLLVRVLVMISSAVAIVVFAQIHGVLVRTLGLVVLAIAIALASYQIYRRMVLIAAATDPDGVVQ
jgi:O-antigen/teichoic acid export membrane protein